MTLPVGIHLGVPHAVYHSDPCERPSLSSHIANTLMTRSPLHAWQEHPRLGGGGVDEQSEAMARGDLIDALMLGGGRNVEVIDAADWRTKAAKEAREAARAEGKIPVLADKFADAQATIKAIAPKLADAGIVFADGQNQVTLVWDRGGILCRSRLDHWRQDLLTVVDLKMCENASPEAFARNAIGYGYHVQAAAYIDGVSRLIPDAAGRVKYLWAICEPNPPYAVVVAEPDGQMMELGRRQWERAIESWRVCLTVNRWPGYGEGIHRISPPEWAMAKDMEQQIKTLEGGSANVGF